MKAAVLFGPQDLRVEERPVPTIGPDDVLIHVAYGGICGSDVHTFMGMQMNIHGRAAGSRVMGHELSGTVAEVGAQVTTCRPGDLVTCIPWGTCGRCPYCRKGLVNHCPNKTLVSGTLAEYALAPQSAVFRLPAGVSLRRAVLAEPLSCCVWATDLANIHSGETVVTVGAGAMGLLLTLLARFGGAAQTIVSEPNATRRALATQLGATLVVDPHEGDLQATALSITDGIGADVAFEAVGHPAAARDAVRVVRNAGTVVIVGVADPSATLPLSLYDVFQRELTIRGCFTRRLSFDRAVQWLPHLDLDPIVTHVFSLDDVASAMEHAVQGKGGKIAIAPNGDDRAPA